MTIRHPFLEPKMWTYRYFWPLLGLITLVEAFLATEQTIPGLGNGVLQDILYNARIHPKTRIHSLSAGQKEELYHQIKSTLQEMYNLDRSLWQKRRIYTASL